MYVTTPNPAVPGVMEVLRGSVSTCLHDSSEEIKSLCNTSLGSFEDGGM